MVGILHLMVVSSVEADGGNLTTIVVSSASRG